MSKKMLKRSLALGALMAFVITGSAMAAEEVTPDFTGQKNITSANGFDGQKEDYWILATGDMESAISGHGTVENVKTLIAESTKNNAITTDGGVLTISAENIILKANESYYCGDNSKPYGNAITAVNNLDVTATGDLTLLGNNRIVRVAAGTTNLKAANIYMNANEDGTATNNLNDDAAIKVDGGATLNIGDENTKTVIVNAVREGGAVYGMLSDGGANINVNGSAKINVKGDSSIRGLRLTNGNITFNDDVELNLETTATGNDIAYGVQNVSNSDNASKVVFNENLKIKVNSAGGAYGLYSSGSAETHAQVLNGDKVEIIVESGGQAVGISASNKGTVKASNNTDVDIRVKSTNDNKCTIGLFNTTISNDGGYGGISLEGNVNIFTEGKYRSAIYSTGGNVTVGSLGKKVVIDGDVDVYGGVVNVAFGAEGSRFEGTATTAASATTTLNFANGATWNLKGASTVTNATFADGSVLKIGKGYEATFDATTGEALKTGNYAITASEGETSLTVEQGAKLQIEGIKETTYNIAQGFDSYDVADKLDIADNALLQANEKLNDGYYQVEVKAKEAEQMATEMGVSNSTAQSIANVTTAAQAAEKKGIEGKADGTGDEKAVALINAMSGVDSKVAGQVFEAVSKMAEAGGNSGTAASIVKNVTGVTNDRLSFNCGHSAPQKGGHGVGLFEEGSGADVWVEYVHGKDKVEDMPSTAGATSYEGQFNGIVMGVDFKKVNKFQSGVAFNYGEGDTNSVGSVARTHSDYDFWGVGYYGNIHNDDSNVIFDIGYAKTESDVESNVLGLNYKASPETTTWTAGVKLEKLYQNENVQIVPYTGLRFMSIDPEDYTTECASNKYQMERQNIWMVPVGVSIKQEVTNDNGWTVSPRVDLSYIWAFGDTDSEMEFSTLGTKTNIGYEVMDDGSFLGLVGIEAHKGQWGYGVAYSYQKGDHSESKKWFVDVNYSF